MMAQLTKTTKMKWEVRLFASRTRLVEAFKSCRQPWSSAPQSLSGVTQRDSLRSFRSTQTFSLQLKSSKKEGANLHLTNSIDSGAGKVVGTAKSALVKKRNSAGFKTCCNKRKKKEEEEERHVLVFKNDSPSRGLSCLPTSHNKEVDVKHLKHLTLESDDGVITSVRNLFDVHRFTYFDDR